MTAFTQAHFERLQQLLEQQGEQATAMTVDQVQGFLLACVSGPDRIDQSFWLPEILADDPFDPADRDEIARLTDALASQLRQQMAAGLEPAIMVFADDDGEPDYTGLCAAYLYALELLPTDWFASRNHDEDLEDLLLPVMAVGEIFEEDDILPLTTAEWQMLRQEMRTTLTAVYQYWQIVLNKPQTVRREGSKTGRNDPCPCGSGKKYKACCGKSA